MSERVQMPALGESVTEGTVTRWLKNVGDSVEVDEPLLEVSTDKVDTEIPSPVAGTLEEILVQEDDTVPVGADLAVIGDGSGGGSSDGGSQSSGEESAAPAQESPAAAESSDSGPADEVSDQSDGDAVAEAGDEGGQEPAEPQASGSASDSGSDSGQQAPSTDAGSGGSADGGSGTTVPMPALGESVTEGTVTRWLKAEGDEVAVDEPLLEVSTDKVDTEIPSPVAGTLTKILVQEDETVPVGADLAIVGGSAGGGSAQAPPQQQAAPAPSEQAQDAPADQGDQQQTPPEATEAPEPQTQQSTPQAEAAPAQQEASAPEQAPAQQEAPAQATPDTAAAQADGAGSVPSTSGAEAPSGQDGGDRDAAAYVTPLVRKLAADHDIDLSTLEGTGIGGRIRKQDVLAAAEAKKAPEPQAAPAAQAPAAATATATAPAPEASSKRGTTETMSRLRKTIARRMVESLQVSAQLTTVVEVDVTRISRLRDRAKGEFAQREGTKLSFLPFFALAAVEALKAHPTVNASIEGDEVTYHGAEHVGIAVDTDKGLIVPVLKNAGDLNIAGLARGIADVADRTRRNKIMPDDLSGGTFTITNTGSRGALFDTPIINQPQVAILGTGAVVKRPVVVTAEDGGETIAIRSMVYLALSYDHRIVDGADAARFLTTMKQRLEEGAFEADLGL